MFLQGVVYGNINYVMNLAYLQHHQILYFILIIIYILLYTEYFFGTCVETFFLQCKFYTWINIFYIFSSFQQQNLKDSFILRLLMYKIDNVILYPYNKIIGYSRKMTINGIKMHVIFDSWLYYSCLKNIHLYKLNLSTYSLIKNI